MIVRDGFVEPTEWLEHHRGLAADGFVSFDLLAATATLNENSIEVASHVMSADGARRAVSRTTIHAAEELESLGEIYPASIWHEREVAELVGLQVGSGAAQPFLLPAGSPPPLAWSSALPERVERAWPGVFEPGGQSESRRKRAKTAPGVREQWAVRHD